MLGYNPPGRHPPGQTLPLGQTPPPRGQTHLPGRHPLPSACWDTQCPVHAGIDMATAAEGMHHTGMHSCHSRNFFLFSLGDRWAILRRAQFKLTSSPWSWLANMSCRVRDEVFSYFSKMFLFQFFNKRTDDCSLRLSSVQHYRAVVPICGT